VSTILISYERESEQTMLEQLLVSHGHQVVRSASGFEALDIARRQPPQLVVADILLPRMDGFALCRKWKQDEQLQAVPFVFYTRQQNDPKYERYAREVGAERFLARVAPESLLDAVEELLRNPARKGEPTEPAPLAQVNNPVFGDRRAGTIEPQTEADLRARIARLEASVTDLTNERASLRRLFEANPQPMWIAARDGKAMLAVNERAVELYGYSGAEFLSLKPGQLSSGAASANDPETISQRRKDGSVLEVALASRPVELNGRPAEIFAAHDMTTRVRAGRKLAEHATLYKLLLHSNPDGCWLLDDEGRMLEVNEAYCRLSGHTREQLLAMSATDIELAAEGEKPLCLRAGKAGVPSSYLAKHRRRDGSTFELDANANVLPDGSHRTLITFRDATARQGALQTAISNAVSQAQQEATQQLTLAQSRNRSERRQIEFLSHLIEESTGFDESVVIHRAIEHAAAITDSPLAFFFLVQPERQTAVLAAWHQPHQTRTPETPPRALDEITWLKECVHTRRPARSNETEPRPQLDSLPALGRWLALPVLAERNVIAVIGVANRGTDYTDQDQQLLTSLVSGIGTTLRARRNHAQNYVALQRAEIALESTIEMLTRLIERHDPHTMGSSRRISMLAVLIGRELGLDGERRHALRVAALLHDIGSILAPVSILSKPGKLNDAELALIRMHAEEGRELLASIDFGAPIAEIVYQHHERYNGSGYPRGLKGEEICMEARILAVADSFEAMSFPRPHRAAVTAAAAMEEIQGNAGRLYDPAVVEVCARLVSQTGFSWESVMTPTAIRPAQE
jgi:PAS domain S-box-containing protein